MSEPQNGPEPGHVSQDAIDRRAWPAARQWRTAGIAAVVALIIILAVWLGGKVFGPHEPPAAAASPPGTFRATPQQLKTFTVETVQMHAFVSEELTEGKIGVNGDRATPVISPYSGRVTRVIAGLGDTVKAGAPLATVEASEFVQAQNDLKVAASQVKLARINETRKHALYDAKGGSLQDWQSGAGRPDGGGNRVERGTQSPADFRQIGRRTSPTLESLAGDQSGCDARRPHRRRGGGSPGGSGPVSASRRPTPVFTIADPSERVAARQRARSGRRLGQSWTAGRSPRAGLSKRGSSRHA